MTVLGSSAILAAIAGLWLSSPIGAEPLLTDEFTSVLGRYELYGGRVWRFGSGECKFQVTQPEAYAVANIDELRNARIEAEFLLERREVPGYVLAGVTLFADTENHWRLLLVQAPDGHRYFEMVERYRGVHQAQTVPGQIRTRLEGRHEGNLGQWDYGRRYRLAISLTSDSIAGEVRAAEGPEFWRSTYLFGQGRAVRTGRPGFMAFGTRGRLKHFAIDGPPPAIEETLQVTPGLLGAVALVKDEANRLAPVLQQCLTAAGFGVRAVSAKELSQIRLSARQVDLLVFADARRVPASAAHAAVSLLRSGGKLLTLGALAFGKLPSLG
ncbi:MAG: hypothetical protein ACLQNE_04835 [Thermoguttaceae bacterium]